MLNFNTCVLTWGSMLMSAVRVNGMHKLYFCLSVVLPVYVFVGMCMVSPCFILPPGVQCSLAILKVRDDTVGEGSVITAIPPSLSLFHVFSSLSCVALGMWTLLNFPPGG